MEKNRVARIMRENGIVGKTKRKFKATTNSKHNYPVAENLLNQQFNVEHPNQVWVAYITYIPTDEGWLYLAAIEDLFHRKIVGWAMDSTIIHRWGICPRWNMSKLTNQLLPDSLTGSSCLYVFIML